MKKILSFLLIATIAFSCDEDLTDAKSITGVWKWQKTCGGFVGCVYAEDDSRKMLLITGDRVIMKEDAAHAEIYAYQTLNKTETETLLSWEIKLSDGSTMVASVEKQSGHLALKENSVVSSDYKRLR